MTKTDLAGATAERQGFTNAEAEGRPDASPADRGAHSMIHLTAKLVAAYLKKNSVATSDIANLIRSTHAALAGTATAQSPAPEMPAVSVKKSVSADAIVCLDCGHRQKMLKRHLHAAHGLSVDEYRAKWELPGDYPMVAPNYAAHRSRLAIKIGLGRIPAPLVQDGSGTEEKTDKPPHQYPPSRWSRPKE